MNVYHSPRHHTLEYKNLRQDCCWNVFVFVGFWIFCLLHFVKSRGQCVLRQIFWKWQMQWSSHEQTSTHVISCESWSGWRVWWGRQCTRTNSKEEEAGSSEYWHFTARNILFLCLAEQIMYQIVAKNIKTWRIIASITWKRKYAHIPCFFLYWLIQLNS